MKITDISVEISDITQLEVDAIVNAANEGLLGGGGVDGAIHHAAGPQLRDYNREVHGKCAVGQAVLSPGFELRAGHIISTVGPRWRGGDRGEAEQLRSCYQSCLEIAETAGIRTMAFPAISTGAFAYPLDKATEIAVHTVLEFEPLNVREVIFCCIDRTTANTYNRILDACEKSPDTCVQLRITGKVQGVWYRASTQKEAKRLGLQGWVKNEQDGSVSAIAMGPESAIRKLIAWCRQGPPGARVDDVEVSKTSPDQFSGFQIIR